MPIWGWVLIAVAAAVLLALGLAAALMRRRTKRLRQQFGPEYERVLQRHGSRRQTDAELASRVERREQLQIRPLSPAVRERYRESWTSVQAQFVDDPSGAVGAADELATSVMRERGYPMSDFESRAADISVDHPQVVERYRSAHGIARKCHAGNATTEDLRQAMQHYRALFNDLVETAQDEPLDRERENEGPTPAGQETEKAGRR